MLYTAIFILLIICTLRFDFSQQPKKALKVYNFVMVILIAVAGLRYKVGGDTLSYYEDFQELPFLNEITFQNLFNFKYSPFWILLSSLSKTLINNFVFFQIIHASFINIVLFRFIKRYTPFKFTAVLIYYIFAYLYFNMEVMRESLAIAMLLIAYPYFMKKNWQAYYLFIAVAILFHNSALLLLILPLFRNSKLSLSNVIILGIVVISISVAFTFIPSLIEIILFSQDVTSKFLYYSDFQANLNGMIGNFVLYGLLPYLSIRIFKRFEVQNSKFEELYLFYFTIVMLYVAVTGFGRFLNYLTPFMFVFFAEFLNRLYYHKRFSRLKRGLVFVIFIFAALPKFIYYTRDTSMLVADTHRYNTWYPYSSIFEKKEYYFREIMHQEGLKSQD
ncbi:EpsG family protein [Flavimarina sp. Hel_I_48]|uniref:EpsG family protein n=1 Tax=Flavimarina sp. Hel_I_48 TaxID=1392488 RepID=UPI0004DF6661|nr:EpsG family protein [Flavimarina sp. Hel_I_48]